MGRAYSCGMADHSTRIAEIDAIIQRGVTSSTVDGETVTYDLDALKAERRRLELDDDAARVRRPVAARIVLGGF